MSFSRATHVGTPVPCKQTSKSSSKIHRKTIQSPLQVNKKNRVHVHAGNNSNARRIKDLNNTVKNMIVQLDQSIDRATVCIAHKKNTFDDDLLKKYIGPLLATRETLDTAEILEISNIIANNTT